MAKKTTEQKPARRGTKKTPAKTIERIEIQLDPGEIKALKLAHSSVEVRTELEQAITLAVSQAVRKVFNQHKITLTLSQAEEVALVLFEN
jgi:hypothetical protein